MQARRQTTLFGGSMACNCGFHVVKPANAPQSVASVSAPGATASAQQTFLRPPLSLSMFTKSRFGGSQSALLKPHLVARKSPSSSPPSPSSVSSPSTSSVRTSMPAPSSVSSPSPSSVSTAVNTILAVGSVSTVSTRLYGSVVNLNVAFIYSTICCSLPYRMSLEEMSQPLLLQLHSGCLGK
ncbi:hypothetical protein KUDE01_016436 [Dissostichus eleginoides]|uniref:Uncharacterized protein n=1 Tax=Dissostichus eleginoides TaxID=100907 RepID=A0AAD9C7E6_DISEL|nr:hypothetical protein KUDE01_016436 [Dissostichus eleginoides]